MGSPFQNSTFITLAINVKTFTCTPIATIHILHPKRTDLILRFSENSTQRLTVTQNKTQLFPTRFSSTERWWSWKGKTFPTSHSALCHLTSISDDDELRSIGDVLAMLLFVLPNVREKLTTHLKGWRERHRREITALTT